MPTIRRTMQNRQIAGAMFGEDAVHVNKTITRDRRGRSVESDTRTAIRLASNPLSPRDPRIAILIEGGTRIEDLREFFTNEKLDPSSRDQIIYEGEVYTIISTARYDGHSESVGQRDEVQP